ncbi:uncharacterized protein LOC130673184 isoform X1 [Microplitis mediator]|uniref:uncharacterized protein LOC130673184 isoform X1 n=1 Tax=Microplitis mediator TaxID=375433 RepID=UPI002552DC81|nr:uncharacterized protein LOC130673184 isoform X1 [Microplitis mediator]
MYYNKYDSVYHRNLTSLQRIIFKIIGLSPWTVEISKLSHKSRKVDNVQNNICYFSYAGSFYNILLIILGVLSILYSSFNNMLEIPERDILVTKNTLSNIKFFSVVEVLIVILIYIFRQNKIINILNQLRNVDNDLQKCAVFTSENNYIVVHFIFFGNFLIYCCYLAMDCYIYQFENILLQIVMLHSPIIIFSWIIVQYTILLDIIDKRFKSINLMIIKLSDTKSHLNQSQILFVSKNLLLRDSVHYDVKNIKCAYVKLCEICGDIADFYGLPILIAITYIGGSSILISYFFMLLFSETIQIDYIVCLCQGMRLLWMALLILMLTTYVTKTINQSNETANIINVLMDRCAMDEKVEKEFVKFLRHLLFRMVKFTACDIISLDCRLLATIAGTVVTYIIILIQFRTN